MLDNYIVDHKHNDCDSPDDSDLDFDKHCLEDHDNDVNGQSLAARYLSDYDLRFSEKIF